MLDFLYQLANSVFGILGTAHRHSEPSAEITAHYYLISTCVEKNVGITRDNLVDILEAE